MKKKTKSLLVLSAAAIAGMYAYNRYVSNIADELESLNENEGEFYSWKEGNIFYKKIGSGKPLLLVHNIDSASSSNEWQKVAKRLSTDHTVYTLDLLGCGQSDKPAIQYTTYLYVQMITSFIKDVIKEKTDIVATNLSSPFVLMANQLDETIIDKIILINPVSTSKMEMIPDSLSKFKMGIINTPIIGTFIYNRMYSPMKLNLRFDETYFMNGKQASTDLKDMFYASSHNNGGKGKYLFSSILGNFMSQNMKHALKNFNKKVLIIASSDMKENHNIIRQYEKNTNFSSIYVSGTKLYPHLEKPEKIFKIIENELIEK